MRQAAYEKRYNEIIDKIIDETEKPQLHFKNNFPIVGLLISTCFCDDVSSADLGQIRTAWKNYCSNAFS